MSSLENITASSLHEQAARAIRTGIIKGQIAPGEIYSVPALAMSLGVSATPVREALLDLVREGLVVPVRNRGFRVMLIGEDDLEEILKLRLLLEVPSMGAVAVSHHDEHLPPFRTLAKEMPEFVRSGDIQTYLDADRDFHLGLLKLLENPRLVEIVGTLRNQSRLFDVGKLLVTDELLEGAVEHGEIIAAIEVRDQELTEAVMDRHLKRLYSRKTPRGEGDGLTPMGERSSDSAFLSADQWR